MKQKKAFTLVEILIVMAILIMLATIMVGILNAIGITNKGRDAQRKKDLNRIKIAFEEYYNDKGEFPLDYLAWNIKSNCKSNVFEPYLASWPCDPNGGIYNILVEPDLNKFRIITNLENKKDKEIPLGWYERKDFNLPALGLTADNANYGVSSANILWYDGAVADYSMCIIGTCLQGGGGGACNDRSGSGCNSNCFYQPTSGDMCTPGICQISCCGNGCP